MSTCSGKSVGTRPATETAVVYGHDTRKFRLRAVNAEKDTFSKLMFKPLGKRTSWAQIIIAVLIAGIQMVTMSLIHGDRYTAYYDSMTTLGGGIWSSLITMFAAFVTLWSIKSVKYWKLHLAFAMHIVSVMGSIIILCVECGGNLSSLRYHAGEALYGDTSGYTLPDRNPSASLSASMLITSLILNTIMATGTLVQLVASFVMTIMTGRAICCGQSKMHGKLFELEFSGSENSEGIAVVKKSSIEATQSELQTGNQAPPPYVEYYCPNHADN